MSAGLSQSKSENEDGDLENESGRLPGLTLEARQLGENPTDTLF